jgi:VanZ family protein
MGRRTAAGLLWTALVCWAGSILYLSSLRPDELPEAAFLFWDKFNHVAAYAVGGWLAASALRASRPQTSRTAVLILAVLMIATFGVLDEAFQTLTSGRSGGDVGDWAADVLGACVGALLGLRRLARSTMTFVRIALASAAAVGGMACAAPAAADSEVFGTYAFAAEDGENATWTLTPCADNPPGCVRVSETGNAKRAPWSGDAHWAVGSLILFVQQPDAILCEDGASAPGLNTYSWEGSSLSGSVSIITKGACGTKSASLSIPFRLTRLGAAKLAFWAGMDSAVCYYRHLFWHSFLQGFY